MGQVKILTGRSVRKVLQFHEGALTVSVRT